MNPFDIISELRKRGYSQSQIARDLQVRLQTINGAIHGKDTNRRVAIYIASKIDKSVDSLWPGRYNRQAKPRTSRRAQS